MCQRISQFSMQSTKECDFPSISKSYSKTLLQPSSTYRSRGVHVQRLLRLSLMLMVVVLLFLAQRLWEVVRLVASADGERFAFLKVQVVLSRVRNQRPILRRNWTAVRWRKIPVGLRVLRRREELRLIPGIRWLTAGGKSWGTH